MNNFNNFSPLDQFNIRNLLSIDGPVLADANISLTNIGLYLSIATLIIVNMSFLTTNGDRLLSNR